MVILAVSVLAKLWLFFFGNSAGKKINSDVIRASATDSLSDAGATLAVLVSAIIAKLSGFDIDGYMGVIVAIIIFIAGIKVLNEKKNSILGSAPEPEVVEPESKPEPVVNPQPDDDIFDTGDNDRGSKKRASWWKRLEEGMGKLGNSFVGKDEESEF